MTTETERVSASAFRVGVVALWERVLRLGRRAPRRLRLCESLPLGERRFVAVVEFDRARFLVGGTPSSLVLLSRLADAGNRAEIDVEVEVVVEVEKDREDSAEDAAWSAATAFAEKRRGETC